MPIKRVTRVKTCNATKNRECFSANRVTRSKRRTSRKRSRVSRKRVSRKRVSRKRSRVSRRRSKVSRKRSKVSRKRSKVSRKRSRVSRKRSRVSRKRSRVSRRRSKTRNSYRGLVLSKTTDIASQIKNFFKIDQEITYMIQHPRKAKKKNILKLLALLLMFLVLLCGVMKMAGGNDYCTPLLQKLKDLASKVKEGIMDPKNSLSQIRKYMAELFGKFKTLRPVADVLSKLGLGDKTPFESEEAQAKVIAKTKGKIEVGSSEKFKDLKTKIEKKYGNNVAKQYLFGIISEIMGDNKTDDDIVGVSLLTRPVLHEFMTFVV